MGSFFLLIIFGLYLDLGSLQEPSKSCEVGDVCQYKCLCTSQCQDDFQCTKKDKCKRGWFGYRCQYQDFAVSGATIKTIPLGRKTDWLLDQDDNTCYYDPYLKSVTWTWAEFKVIPLTWTRMAVTDLRRNIAYKQNATQSSVYPGFEKYTADLAVDGNTNPNVFAGSCSHTNEETSPSWNLTLQSSYVMTRVILYNRDNFSERLLKFVINAYDMNGEVVGFYGDKESSAKPIFYINFNESMKTTVKYLHIHLSGNMKILTLCEVEAYGECPSGHWSLSCSKRCPVSCPDNCDRDTGACNSICIGYNNPPQCDTVCSAGKWGINCRYNCSNRCVRALCNVKTGLCDQGCHGYRDSPYCGTVCSRDRWGINCSHRCSEHCHNPTCNPVSGECHQGCKPGYLLPDCTMECPKGQWGSNCTSTCSENCFDKLCNTKEGSCDFGCVEGFQTPICLQKCVSGTYGRNCSYNCSSLCLNGECDPVNGTCNRCPAGFEGQACELKIFRVEFSSFGIGIAIGGGAIVLVILVVLLIIYHPRLVLWRQRSRFACGETNLQVTEGHIYDHILQTDLRDGEVNHVYETSVLTSPAQTEYSTAEPNSGYEIPNNQVHSNGLCCCT